MGCCDYDDFSDDDRGRKTCDCGDIINLFLVTQSCRPVLSDKEVGRDLLRDLVYDGKF